MGVIQLGGSEEYRRLCVRLAAEHNIRIADPELQAEVQPRVGQRVIFHARNAKATLTGDVVALDSVKGTATLRVGNKLVPVVSDKGFFTEADPSRTREPVETPERKNTGGRRQDSRDSGWER